VSHAAETICGKIMFKIVVLVAEVRKSPYKPRIKPQPGERRGISAAEVQ
jgi:hypothetical protein